MGTGGGYKPFSHERYQELKAEAEDTVGEEAKADINKYLNEALSKINDRDAAEHGRRMQNLVDLLEDSLVDVEKMLFGGSVAKHTYVDGLSDVDALLLLEADAAGSPREVLRELATRIRSSAGNEILAVETGNLAITVRYKDGLEVQLLPAFRKGDGFAIASSDGSEWSPIRPRGFAEKITSVNKNLSNKLVPVIKLAKSAISSFPDDRRLTGYHVEALAIQAFEAYKGGHSLSELVTHFFQAAASGVRKPIRDSTGQSIHVDEYLGPADSLQRKRIADSLGRCGRRLAAATKREQWSNTLGDDDS